MDRVGTVPGDGAASPGSGAHRVGAREQWVEVREQQVAERERAADEREDRLARRAAWLRRHSAEVRAELSSARERAEQVVERTKAQLDASRHRVLRAAAALNRAYAHVARERAKDSSATWRGEERPTGSHVDFAELIARVSALRERTAAAAAQLADSEEIVARVHDGLAFCEPGNPGYKRLAREARKAACSARAAERRYSNSWPSGR